MATIYVARSVMLGKWGSDVGVSKHLYKLGLTTGDAKAEAASGWCGLTDWSIVKRQDCADDIAEAEAIERAVLKVKLLEPRLYPRIKTATGIFKILPAQVENYIVLTRALAGNHDAEEIKLKPADYADFLLHQATRRPSAE